MVLLFFLSFLFFCFFFFLGKTSFYCSITLDKTWARHVALFGQVSCRCVLSNAQAKYFLMDVLSEYWGKLDIIIFQKGSFHVWKDISFEKWGKEAVKIFQIMKENYVYSFMLCLELWRERRVEVVGGRRGGEWLSLPLVWMF